MDWPNYNRSQLPKNATIIALLFILIVFFTMYDQDHQPSGSLMMTPIVLEEVSFLNRNISLRYWSLINANSSQTKGFPKATSQETIEFPNLWRLGETNEILPSVDGGDRLMEQLNWGMEGRINSSESIKMKYIYVPDPQLVYEREGKPPWTYPHTLNQEDCPGHQNIFQKCTFTQVMNESVKMDAMITARTDYNDEKDLHLPENLLRFYYMEESPSHSHFKLRRTNDLLATYYRGSDVPAPYAKWVYYDPEIRFKSQGKNFSRGKSKMAAIFVSNCSPNNNRMGYVKQLKRFIEVDIFGRCGGSEVKSCVRGRKECFEMLKRDYRFYLSFENSNCRDYVTEKLFLNAFGNDIIPVVLGAHPADYTAMCPEGSYIHVEDFPNPKALSEYLKHLAESPEEYNEYFRWKGTGQFIDTRFYCRICAMVHYSDMVPPPERKAVFKWDSRSAIKSRMCLPNRKWYWK